MNNPNFQPRAYAPGAALKFLEAAPHLDTCTCFTLGTCSCGRDAALDEVRSMQKTIKAQAAAIHEFDTEE